MKLHPNSNKILYVCNGKISPKCCALYEKTAKHFLKKGDLVETPVLAFVKGGSHVLLETLSMDDVEQLEKLIPEIRNAFKEAENHNHGIEGTEHREINYKI